MLVRTRDAPFYLRNSVRLVICNAAVLLSAARIFLDTATPRHASSSREALGPGTEYAVFH